MEVSQIEEVLEELKRQFDKQYSNQLEAVLVRTQATYSFHVRMKSRMPSYKLFEIFGYHFDLNININRVFQFYGFCEREYFGIFHTEDKLLEYVNDILNRPRTHEIFINYTYKF